jgi:predicted membrane channel-forming protein YqfA (hemolysin III family)
MKHIFYNILKLIGKHETCFGIIYMIVDTFIPIILLNVLPPTGWIFLIWPLGFGFLGVILGVVYSKGFAVIQYKKDGEFDIDDYEL